MEENSLHQVVMGTVDTTLMERVGPSSSGAEGDRLPVHLNSSYSAACLGDTEATTKSS